MRGFIQLVRVVLLVKEPVLMLISTSLRNKNNVEIIGKYSDYADIPDNLLKDQPDIILADVDLLPGSGSAYLSKLKNRLRRVEIVLLSDNIKNPDLINLLAGGATGLLLKSDVHITVHAAIETITAGGAPIHPLMMRLLLNGMQITFDSVLTNQERKILKLLAAGLGAQAIANELFISVETARTHLKNIYRKLKVNSKSQALKVAKQRGLTPLLSLNDHQF